MTNVKSMTNVKRTCAVILLALTAAAVPAAGAQAHWSTYCGHGSDGYWTKTVFRSSYWSNGHVHVYDHYDVYGGSHRVWKYC